MTEEWRPIEGYEGRYEVSIDAHVRSLASKFGPRLLMLKQVIASDGYLAVSLFDGRRAKTHPVHVLVAKAFLGERSDGHEINHISGDKLANAATNLEYCTRSRNMQHAFAMGLNTSRKGVDHHKAKLTEDDVREVRRLLREGRKQAEVAVMMKVSVPTISHIKTGLTWSHLPAQVAVGA